MCIVHSTQRDATTTYTERCGTLKKNENEAKTDNSFDTPAKHELSIWTD